jgi:hypothetical protein
MLKKIQNEKKGSEKSKIWFRTGGVGCAKTFNGPSPEPPTL